MTGPLTSILGEPCPECWWRRGAHRPPIKVMHLDVAPCPRYTPEVAA